MSAAIIPPKYSFKVPRFNPVLRLAWWLVVRHCMNRDRYTFRKHYNGKKRYPSDASVPRENATATRYYMETRPALAEHERIMALGTTADWHARREARGLRGVA